MKNVSYDVSNIVFSGSYHNYLYDNKKYPVYYKQNKHDPYENQPSNEPINISEERIVKGKKENIIEKRVKVKIKLETLDKSKCEYDPSRFPGAKIRFTEEDGIQVTFLFFSTSKFVCTGLDDEKSITKAVELLTNYLNVNNIPVSEPETHIVNIVANGLVGNNIDLNSATWKLNNVIYEPEVFPGLIYHHDKDCVVNKDKIPEGFTHTVVLIFMSGKAVITGLKTFEHVAFAVQDLKDLLKLKNLNYHDDDLKDTEFELDIDKLL